jgi:hypothetical protein
MLEEVGDTSMRRGILVTLSATLIIAGCAAPMTMREIRAVNPNCARISKQIALLEKEKAQNNYRILAGIQTVAPALAVLNIVAGRYGQNVAIATGEWGQTIDRKLVELRRAKRRC